MIIKRIAVYRLILPLDYVYTCSSIAGLAELDDTVVAVTTESGLTGWGEACPPGSSYLPAFAPGVRSAIAELAPHLLGQNAVQLQKLNDRMDRVLPGHNYAKSAIDVACWDLLGRMSGLAVCDLLGGRYEEAAEVVRGIPTDSPEAMIADIARHRSQGIRTFSFKLGGDPAADIRRIRAIMDAAEIGDAYIADANRGFSPSAAIRLMQAVEDLDLAFEQPCETYEQCVTVRRQTRQPLVLDECIHTAEDLLRAVADRAADMINLKLARIGGLTRLRKMRDLCVDAGLTMTIQDAGGADLVRSAITHLAQSTPKRYRHSLWDPMEWHSVALSERAGAELSEGRLSALDSSGLGVEPSADMLGAPCMTFEAQGPGE